MTKAQRAGYRQVRFGGFRPGAARWVTWAVALVALAWGEAQAVVVTKASDVCAPAADPCLVTSEMEIPDGLCTNDADQPCSSNADCSAPGFCSLGSVVLDFGVRDVELSGGGRFDFGTSSGRILCGNFTATNSGATIDANGVVGDSSESGSVFLRARRLCSAATSPFPCVFDSDCQLGACGTRRCSLAKDKVCLDDPDCSIGPCIQKGTRHVCTKQQNRRCLTNADCELGSCPIQTTCENAAGGVLNCSTDEDCDQGACSVGTASILIGGTISGFSEFPAFLDFRASDDIVTEKLIHIDGTTADSDGGEIRFETAFGSITVNGDIDASSGGFGVGGTVSLLAGEDVHVADIVNVTGGDLDGGTILIQAGRDVIIGRSLLGNSGSGIGWGGDFSLSAGRDLTVTGASSANKTLLTTSGHADAFGDAGSGGPQDLIAGRNLFLDQNTRIVSNGAAPYGLGGEVYLTATETLTVDGDVTAMATGGDGAGGLLEALSGGNLILGSTSVVDVSGSPDDSGTFSLESGGNIDLAGKIDLGPGDAGGNGYGLVLSDSDVSISGQIRMNRGDDGALEIEACRITLTDSGALDAGSGSSTHTVLTAHESMTLEGGSLVKTGPGGSNNLVYRAASKPPVIDGTVTPTAIVTLDADLSPCPVCGNGELDGGETCEDGNTVDGDGCSSQCQNENCVVQTAPQVECTTNADCGPSRTCSEEAGFCTPWDLCEDGDPCTIDTCDPVTGGGSCQHPPRDCSDGFACTTDSCDGLTGACTHVPDDGACDDGNPCTDDACTLDGGCAGVANSELCDDGDPCTEDDTCTAGSCAGSPINGCAVCGDGVFSPATEQCDDGNDTFTEGEYCGVGCMLVPCGKPTGSAGVLPKASDAQFTLRAAVGQVDCCLRVCDVDDTGAVLASDAQRTLRKAVGQDLALTCPATGSCPP